MREFFLTQCWPPIQLQCGSRSSMLELCNALYKLNVLFVLLCFNFSETVRLSWIHPVPQFCVRGGGGGSLQDFTVSCHRGIRCLAQLGLGSPGAPCFCRGCVTRQCVETSVSICDGVVDVAIDVVTAAASSLPLFSTNNARRLFCFCSPVLYSLRVAKLMSILYGPRYAVAFIFTRTWT